MLKTHLHAFNGRNLSSTRKTLREDEISKSLPLLPPLALPTKTKVINGKYLASLNYFEIH